MKIGFYNFGRGCDTTREGRFLALDDIKLGIVSRVLHKCDTISRGCC